MYRTINAYNLVNPKQPRDSVRITISYCLHTIRQCKIFIKTAKLKRRKKSVKLPAVVHTVQLFNTVLRFCVGYGFVLDSTKTVFETQTSVALERTEPNESISNDMSVR